MARSAGRVRRGPGLVLSGPPAQERAALRSRAFAFVLAGFVLAIAVIVFPQPPVAAASSRSQHKAEICTIAEWRNDIQKCVGRLADVGAARAQCLKAPPPEAPDSGLGGWFASRPESSRKPGATGPYSQRAYAGYSFTTYDIGCASTLMHPDYKFENTVANGEFMLATAVVGASNALRERAWDPGAMWAWADPLVEKATTSIYSRVFTVFGAITVAIVGIYLLWRSRQAELSNAMTTAAWALLVMVIVTALASWPVFSAHLADKALVTSLGAVHSAIGPPRKEFPAGECPFANPDACKDFREPAVRASDTAVETMLYRNWLRGVLGSADSDTAKKYGEALYQAKTLSWQEVERIRANPETRDELISRKATQWTKVAEQVRLEDAEAYEYLTGSKGMERIGAGLVTLVGSVLYALFDLTASILILLGFLVFRWAVIAAPLLGTVGILRPASAGFRRLMNAVVAALFNVVIFGSGAAIYLFAVDTIMTTATIPGWLQVVLIGLCGVAGWLLLRPYRRITHLGGGVSAPAALAGRTRSRPSAESPGSGRAARVERGESDRLPQRVELRSEAPIERPPHLPPDDPAPPTPRRRTPAPTGGGWSEPELEQEPPTYTIYRPRRSPVTPPPGDRSPTAGPRVEARRES